MRTASVLLLASLLLWAAVAPAAVPQTISYQGILRDAGGTIVADGNYTLTFKLYSVASGGSPLWTESQTLAVADGVFNAALGSVTALTLDFNTPYWLGVAVGAAPELTPRIALAAAPYGLNADRLDGLSSESFAASTHSHALDALSDVNAPTPSTGQVLTYNAGSWVAQTPAAGDDGDWVISGDNLYHLAGKVAIGLLPAKETADGAADGRQGRNAAVAKLQVTAVAPAQEGGVFAHLLDYNGSSDARAAVYAWRESGLNNAGAGLQYWQTNNAVTGLNSWGDTYSFGVAGYTFFDSPNTAGVLGSHYDASVWGALGFMDAESATWGLYTPNSAYLGGLRIPTGSGAGKVLTSDANGVATWQDPVPDGQWTTSGDNLYRSLGKVGIGLVPARLPAGEEPTGDRAGRNATAARLQVYGAAPGQEGGLYAQINDWDYGADERAAVYGMRYSALNNPGSGFAHTQTNNAVTGWNSWGDPYSFGVAGYTWFDNPNTAGVLGANEDASVWGALGYQDTNYNDWGLYTPGFAFVGGRVGIGTGTPDRPLRIEGTGNLLWAKRLAGGAVADDVAVQGLSKPADAYGWGGWFEGGAIGVRGTVFPTGGSLAGPYTGVYGHVWNPTGLGYRYGVYGRAEGGEYNYSVYGYAPGPSGVSYAGYFAGNVHVSGTLSKSAGSFKIDHPLDPANKTLSHSFVESPDMMNVYNGNVVLGADGAAWVELPEWFEALNRDFRYQLTCIGGFAPVYVAEKVKDSRFRVAGGTAGLEVSWMVTGIRQDAYANAHRIPVEELKPEKERGRYLNAEAFGLPAEMDVDHQMERNVDVTQSSSAIGG